MVQEEGEPNFSMVLYKLMEDHKLTPKDMIKKTMIERSYFYHILSGKKRNPSRNMVLRIGICAGANIQDMNRLLRMAGTASLYPKIRRDALLIHAIDKKMDMEQANLLLIKSGEIPLYRDEKHGQTQS